MQFLKINKYKQGNEEVMVPVPIECHIGTYKLGNCPSGHLATLQTLTPYFMKTSKRSKNVHLIVAICFNSDNSNHK